MKKTLQTFTFSLLSLTAVTQVTINGSDINPSVGQSFSANSTNYVSPGASGASQTWNFSGLTSTGVSTINIVAFSTNGANQAQSAASGAMIHYKNDASAQEIKYVTSSGTTFTYVNGEKLLVFPLSLGSSSVDPWKATFMSGGTYPATRTGTTTSTMDGYGTLILPSQTLTDVIRVKIDQVYADTIDIQGTPYIINYSSEIYIWYKAGFKSQLLSMTSFTSMGNTTTYGSYTASTSVGVDLISGVEKVTVLGNPFTSNLSFSIESTKDLDIKYELVSITGSVIYSSNEASLSNGVNTLSIPSDNLAKGTYVLKISNGNSTISKLVIKE